MDECYGGCNAFEHEPEHQGFDDVPSLYNITNIDDCKFHALTSSYWIGVCHIKQYVDECGLDINIQDKHGLTPLISWVNKRHELDQLMCFIDTFEHDVTKTDFLMNRNVFFYLEILLGNNQKKKVKNIIKKLISLDKDGKAVLQKDIYGQTCVDYYTEIRDGTMNKECSVKELVRRDEYHENCRIFGFCLTQYDKYNKVIKLLKNHLNKHQNLMTMIMDHTGLNRKKQRTD